MVWDLHRPGGRGQGSEGHSRRQDSRRTPATNPWPHTALTRLLLCSPGDPLDSTLELARKLVRSDEKILAIYEPGPAGYRAAICQFLFDMCMCPCVGQIAFLINCPWVSAYLCVEECRGHDDSYFVVTDQNLYKQQQKSTNHKQGRIKLKHIYHAFYTDQMPNSAGLGKCCCPTDNVTIEVKRGHPVAEWGGYKPKQNKYVPPNAIIIFADDAPEAAAIIRAAVKASTADESSTDKYWHGLSQQQKEAAQTLGYNEKKWNKGRKVPADDKDWSALSSAEQAAAATLGYTQESWDDSSGGDTKASSGGIKPESMKRDGPTDADWDDLTEEQRKAAQTLGYNKKKWDKGKKVPADDEDWAELKYAQQEAAKTLGYTQASWDADDDSSDFSA